MDTENRSGLKTWLRWQVARSANKATIEKAFFTKFHPSMNAIAAYLTLKFNFKNASVPELAKLTGISVTSFRRGTAELVEKGVLRVHRQNLLTGKGTKQPLPNVYEILDEQAWTQKTAA